jgi:hypothetical protein
MNLKILNELDRILKRNPALVTDTASLCQVVNGIFNIELDKLPTMSSIYELSDIIDNAVLANYFSKVWQPETKKYKYSGLSIIDEVNAMNPESVIDIGCGYNEFKGKINNLTGIDPYNTRADIMVPLLEFDTEQTFDVAICLGSINFGSSDKIIAELTAAVNLVKGGGLMYFRVNPGEQHIALESTWINFYDWDPVFISNMATLLDCELLALRRDLNRLYFVLRKRKI